MLGGPRLLNRRLARDLLRRPVDGRLRRGHLLLQRRARGWRLGLERLDDRR